MMIGVMNQKYQDRANCNEWTERRPYDNNIAPQNIHCNVYSLYK